MTSSLAAVPRRLPAALACLAVALAGAGQARPGAQSPAPAETSIERAASAWTRRASLADAAKGPAAVR
jgi:hypothetical protein